MPDDAIDAAPERLQDLRILDPACGSGHFLVELRRGVREETGLPEELTDRIVGALAGADHLGSLLKVGQAVRGAIEEFVERRREEIEQARQGNLFEDDVEVEEIEVDVETLMEALLLRLETFLTEHTGGDDLGLRLHGEQLAAGMRFVRLLREDTYDLVVGNPPYQGTSKMADAAYVKAHYPRGKADLYAAFLERGLELVRPGGVSAMLTLRNWMFISQYEAIRSHLLEHCDLRALGDLDRGAFEDIPDEVVAVAISIFRRATTGGASSCSNQPTPLDDRSRDSERTARKRAAVLAQEGRYEFSQRLIHEATGKIVYWWPEGLVEEYAEIAKLGDMAPVRQGLATAKPP